MCLDKHYLGMSNPGLYLLSSIKKILALSTYPVCSHPHAPQSFFPVIFCWHFDAESGDRREAGRKEMLWLKWRQRHMNCYRSEKSDKEKMEILKKIPNIMLKKWK